MHKDWKNKNKAEVTKKSSSFTICCQIQTKKKRTQTGGQHLAVSCTVNFGEEKRKEK